MSAPTQDLDAILRTLREVEESLDRRFARAEGALVMIWGLVGFSIFAFYQLVEWDPAPFVAALGGLVSWAWVLPMALGYVASGIVGARLGRMRGGAAREDSIRRNMLPGLLIAAFATTLVLTRQYHYIYGGVTLLGGLFCLTPGLRAHGTLGGRVGIGVGLALSVVGAALLYFADQPLVPGVAAVSFLAGYLLLGTVKYRLGR